MTRRTIRTARLCSIIAGVAVFNACPVPASYTTAESAPVSGRIVWGDGTAASDIPVLLSTEWGRRPCEKVALRTATDNAGAFELAEMTTHHSVMWFVPNLDVVAPRFDVCVSVRDTVRRVYTGVGSLSDKARRDSLSCVVWQWGESPRVSCNGSTMAAVVSGGSWGDSAHTGRTGSYRVFLTEEPTQVKGYKKNYPQDRPYVYVQWVKPLSESTGARIGIDTTVNLPINRNKVTSIRQMQLWRREGRWMLSLEGYKKDFMSDFDRAELIFALGAPGDATLVAGP